MSVVNESRTWREDFTGLVDDDDDGSDDIGVSYYGKSSVDTGVSYYDKSSAAVNGGGKIGLAAAAEEVVVGGDSHDWRYHAVEFGKGAAEMSVEFGKGVRDVLKQTVMRDDSVVVRKLRGPCRRVASRLMFLNEYLPEDRDPVHAWSVIFFVLLIAFAVLVVNTDYDSTPSVKKMYIHPPSARLILLPDGRHLAYQEQGVSADQARFSVILPHSFLSSRLAGIPGVKASLLQEFGVRLVSYDLPGFGESDPHPARNLHSSALDMLHLSYAANVTDKFWVMGHSLGSMHVWAALRYIPDRIAGAVMIAPMMNPYEPRMTKQERRRIWDKWTTRKKLMYFLAQKFPRLLPYFYRRSFLSGNHGRIDNWMSLSPGQRDRALIEGQMFEEFWQRDVEESVRQSTVKPFVEEATLQVSHWGFSLADLKVRKEHQAKGILTWFKSIYGKKEESLKGYLGPIHIWQGMEDTVVPPLMSDFVQRILPDVMVHKLLYEGHFTYFYFCDECHRQIFTTVFGNPQGPLTLKTDETPIMKDKDTEVFDLEDMATDTDNASSLSDTSEVEDFSTTTCRV